MKRFYILNFGLLYFIFFTSCCEKNYEPDAVDQVVGIYAGELKNDCFSVLPYYKVKVTKLSKDMIKIASYIGNEIERPIEVYLYLSSDKTKLIDDFDEVQFNIGSEPFHLHFNDSNYCDEFTGFKIE